jgi:hypothetical protein
LPPFPGNNTDVGDVLVRQEGAYLYVQYLIADPTNWCMTMTHLAVGASLGDIPQTHRGNPIPNRFPYEGIFKNGCGSEFLFKINIAAFKPGTTLFIAAHAYVRHQKTHGNEHGRHQETHENEHGRHQETHENEHGRHQETHENEHGRHQETHENEHGRHQETHENEHGRHQETHENEHGRHQETHENEHGRHQETHENKSAWAAGSYFSDDKRATYLTYTVQDIP